MSRANHCRSFALLLLSTAGCNPYGFVSMGDVSELGGRSGRHYGGTSATFQSAGTAAGGMSGMNAGGVAGVAGDSAVSVAGAAGSGSGCPASACGPLSTLTIDVTDQWLTRDWLLKVCFNTECLQAEFTLPAGDMEPQHVTQPPRQPDLDGFHTKTAISRVGNGTRFAIDIFLTQNESRSRLQDGDRFTATLGRDAGTALYSVAESASYSIRRPECSNCLTATLSEVPPTLIRRRVTQIAATLSHACAIADQKVFCWGNNSWGNLGNGTKTESQIPVHVTGLPGVPLAIALGTDHTCATTADGVYCWGHLNDSAVLSSQKKEFPPPDPYTPTTVLAAVYGATCINALGRVACWGMESFHPDNLSINPIALTGLYGHFCAISTERAVYCWGASNDYALGGPVQNNANWTAVAGLDAAVTSISAGRRQTCAVMSGEAYCWGTNRSGVLGDGTTFTRASPIKVIGLPGRVDWISTGLDSTCAIVAGALYCWGDNSRGQLGNGSTDGSYAPTAIPGLASGAEAVSVGYRFACAIAEGRAYCWGSNENSAIGSTGEMSRCSDASCSLSPREVLFPELP